MLLSVSDPPVFRWCGHELASREDQACPGCNELVGPRADYALKRFSEGHCGLRLGGWEIEKSPAQDTEPEK
jgi:hypothetical protein